MISGFLRSEDCLGTLTALRALGVTIDDHGAQLSVATVFDVHTGGQQRITHMINAGVVRSDQLIPITAFTKTKQADMEDMFDPAFYLRLIEGCGIASLKVQDLPPGHRIVKRIADAIERDFDHYEPAFYLLCQQHDLLDAIDEATMGRFEQP